MPSGSWWNSQKTARRTAETPKSSRFDCFSGVSAVLPAVFRLFTATCSASFSAVFRLFSMSGIWRLCRWPQRLQPESSSQKMCHPTKLHHLKELMPLDQFAAITFLPHFGEAKKIHCPIHKNCRPEIHYFGIILCNWCPIWAAETIILDKFNSGKCSLWSSLPTSSVSSGKNLPKIFSDN